MRINDLERNRADSTPQNPGPTTDSFSDEPRFFPDGRSLGACTVLDPSVEKLSRQNFYSGNGPPMIGSATNTPNSFLHFMQVTVWLFIGLRPART